MLVIKNKGLIINLEYLGNNLLKGVGRFLAAALTAA